MKGYLATAFSVAIALSASILPTSAIAADLKEVDCNGFSLVYDNHPPDTKCYAVDDSGIQTSWNVKRIIALAPSYQLVFTYIAAGHSTYIPIQSLQKQIDDAKFFADTDDWLPERKYGGFDIALFKGIVKDGDPPLYCAVFARYSGQPGNYEFDNGPGYKDLAQGLYCALSGGAALMSSPDSFYREVEDVIGKLHMPN